MGKINCLIAYFFSNRLPIKDRGGSDSQTKPFDAILQTRN